MRVVMALGGNALLRRGEPLTEEVQRRNVKVAAEAVAQVAALHQTIVTHGNGPQVGLLALASEAYEEVPAYGLGVLGAESQGMIGFLLEQALRSRLPERSVATLLTSVLVEPDDPGLARPTKPVGPVYREAVARSLGILRGWTVTRDGDGYRRVVASPQPQEILELRAIRAVIDAGVLLICAGGGGVPMVRRPDGELISVDGVVDKDLTSALLAKDLQADVLLLLTDVSSVVRDWNTPQAQPIGQATVAELRALHLAEGSMGPKAEAACRFVERCGGRAVIGALSDAAAMLDGSAGTQVLA